MAENIHINLSEEIEQDLLQKYNGLCESLTKGLNTMRSGMEEICQRTKYEPMINVVNETINLFDSEIHSESLGVLDEWLEGEGSFSAAAEMSQSGQTALETARQIEQKIRDTFEGFWSSHPMGTAFSLDTSRPMIKGEDFDELKEVYTKFFQEVESTGEDAIRQIGEQGNDDPTYNVIIPAMKALTEPTKNAFEEFCTKIDKSKEESEGLKQQQSAKNDEASEAATRTSASTKDIADALKMFEDI